MLSVAQLPVIQADHIRMPLQIRPANLAQDRAEMIALFRRYLTPGSDEKRFDWLYRDAPHGTARAWVALDSEQHQLAGAAAAFPRSVTVDGNARTGWVLGDFCFSERFRTLGPALQLQRACLQSLEKESNAFIYDFPSQSMMAIYKRIGIAQTGTLARWAKPLRIEGKIEKITGSKILSRALGALADVVVAQQGWRGDQEQGDLALHEGTCGEEFTALDRRVREKGGVYTVRDASYLNWRFLAHPATRYEVLTARRNGTLVGYTIFGQHGEDANIADVSCTGNPALVARLLAGTVETLRAREVVTVSMNAGENHPWNRVFERAGFRKRESSPVITHSPQEPALFGPNHDVPWHLMQGERDS